MDTDIGESNHSSNSLGEIEAGEMFNDLCREVHVPLQLPHERVLTFFRGRQTFIAASKAHYESQSTLLIYPYNLNANLGDLEREEREEISSNVYDPSFKKVDERTPEPSGSLVVPKFPRTPARRASEPKRLAEASRRELIWRPREGNSLNMDRISQQFRSLAEDAIRASSHSPLQRRQARSAPKTPHRCLGYNLEEIALTPDVSKSAIVSLSTPTPGEICSLCGGVVGRAEIFHCVCGTDGELLITLILILIILIIFTKMMEFHPPSSASSVQHGNIGNVWS